MTLEEFYTIIKNLLPYRQNPELDIRRRLNDAFTTYIDSSKEFGVDGETLSEIQDITRILSDIISNYQRGLYSTAYSKLQNLIQGKVGLPPKIKLLDTLLEFDDRAITFYRIRQMDSIYGVKPEEMFHIPLNRRGIVRTQRYSAPGYPCLYLGESIYGCWEEMRRPSMEKCAVARLECQPPLKIVDLTIPDIDSLRLSTNQKLIPLLISCMLPVKNHDDNYKPEYIIPQLIIQWVIKNRGNIDGVCYTSSHINEDFNFPDAKFVNYAIPVYSVDSRQKYCKRLCKMFKITDPTTNSIEKLKLGYGIDGGFYGADRKALKEHLYKISDFGHLEERLSDTRKFPLHEIKCR